MSTFIYPLDPKGELESNVIREERHTIAPGSVGELFILTPRLAPFFQKDLVIEHTASGTILTQGLHFAPTHQIRDLNHVTDESVYASITLFDRTLTGEFKVTYRTLGGAFTVDDVHIIREALLLNNQGGIVYWEKVIGKPDAFPPDDHEVAAEQIVGMDDVVEALRGLALPNRHYHDIGGITGLQAALDTKMGGSGPHRFHDNILHRTVGAHTGGFKVRLPKVNGTSIVMARILVETSSHAYNIELGGKVVARDSGTRGAQWEEIVFYPNNNMPDTTIHCGYDEDNYPCIYIGDGKDWSDPTIAILETFSSTGWWEDTPVPSDSRIVPYTTISGILFSDVPVGIESYLGKYNQHLENKENPHGVTKDQVQLGKVNNWGASSRIDLNSAETYATSAAIHSLNQGKLSNEGGNASGDYNIDGDITVNNITVKNNWKTLFRSDRKIKSEITPLQNPLEEVAKWEVASYIKHEKYEIGFISNSLEGVEGLTQMHDGILHIVGGGYEMQAYIVGAIQQMRDMFTIYEERQAKLARRLDTVEKALGIK